MNRFVSSDYYNKVAGKIFISKGGYILETYSRRSHWPYITLAVVFVVGAVFAAWWFMPAVVSEVTHALESQPPTPAQAELIVIEMEPEVTQSTEGYYDAHTMKPDDEVLDTPSLESDPANPAANSSSDDDWRLMLVSPNNPVGYDFTPPQLETIVGEHRVDSRVATPLREMMASAYEDGVTLMIVSAYRPATRQAVLHNQQIERFINLGHDEEEAVAVASTIVLPPGTSEHQTGLAVDIVTPHHQMLTDYFADTPAGVWLAENSWRYGFILRYPRDSIHITGVIFEPWHFRYVGREHAQAIFEGGYIFEEYLLMHVGP